MSNNVEYKGVLLSRNSEAFQLWVKKEFNKLDQHLKALDVKNRELMERYAPKANKEQS